MATGNQLRSGQTGEHKQNPDTGTGNGQPAAQRANRRAPAMRCCTVAAYLHTFLPRCQLRPYVHNMTIASSPHPCIAYIHPYLLRVHTYDASMHMITCMHACQHALNFHAYVSSFARGPPNRSTRKQSCPQIMTSNEQTCHDHQRTLVRSRANMVLLTSKRLPPDHKRAWSCIYHEQTSPA